MAMSTRQNAVSREALARLPSLNLGELRQQWRGLYKAAAPAHFSRELLMRAVAYRLQELALGGLLPEPQRRLRQIARELNETGAVRIGPRPALKPGSRLIREWQGRTYEVLVLDDGFSWQGSHYRSLSLIARTITGTPRSGPLFFGLKPNRSAIRLSARAAAAASAVREGGDAPG
jgi:Protein of unknown function (DUF2924)